MARSPRQYPATTLEASSQDIRLGNDKREVSSIDLTLEKGSAPKAIIKAKGKVVTAGHTNPRLLQVLYMMPPADGIQDFDFYVDPPPPSAVVAQVIADIETPPLRLEHIPPWMKGVRVRAQTNSLDRSF
jgi:hypothetical protein